MSRSVEAVSRRCRLTPSLVSTVSRCVNPIVTAQCQSVRGRIDSFYAHGVSKSQSVKVSIVSSVGVSSVSERVGACRVCQVFRMALILIRMDLGRMNQIARRRYDPTLRRGVQEGDATRTPLKHAVGRRAHRTVTVGQIPPLSPNLRGNPNR